MSQICSCFEGTLFGVISVRPLGIDRQILSPSWFLLKVGAWMCQMSIEYIERMLLKHNLISSKIKEAVWKAE